MAFRQEVLQNSAEQRRTTPHNGGMTRSLVEILYDRQSRGARAISLVRHHVTTTAQEQGQQEDEEEEEEQQQQRRHRRGNSTESPSTVFDTATLATSKQRSGRQEQQQQQSSNEEQSVPVTTPGTHVTQAQELSQDTAATPIHQRQEEQEHDETETDHIVNNPCASPATANTTSSSSTTSSSTYREPGPCNVHSELLYYVEYVSSVRHHSAFLPHLGGNDEQDEHGHRPLSSRAVSTISIAFSADSQTMASTHGDHTVKISSCLTGRLLESLDGHPRTPWTVKFHPHHSHIVASGCLGHQVRVWNWPERTCLHMVRLEFAIISLTFHPSGQVLAVANGTRLHFWGLPLMNRSNNTQQRQQRTGLGGATPLRYHHNSHYLQQQNHRTAASATTTGTTSTSPTMASLTTTTLTEMDQRHMLRCVHFPPDGKTLIIGGVNAPHDDPRRRTRPGMGGGGMSFYLRLWDFHLDVALTPHVAIHAAADPQNPQQQQLRSISNPRIFVPRALLYNDGGFDVSPDGKVLCACVEYWLPDGVDNAMELVNNEERLYEQKTKAEEEEEQQRWQHEQLLENNSNNQIGEKNLDALDVASTHTHNTNSVSTPSATTPRILLRTTSATSNPSNPYPEVAPTTPEPTFSSSTLLSPPPPPGRRFMPSGGLLFGKHHHGSGSTHRQQQQQNGTANPNSSEGVNSPPPLPHGSNQQGGGGNSNHANNSHHRAPHPLSTVTSSAYPPEIQKGRYVPHVVTISLDTTPLDESLLVNIEGPPHPQQRTATSSNTNINKSNTSSPHQTLPAVAVGYRPRLGQLLDACPLDGGKATAVTCVKFSPATNFCLIGYGVREPIQDRESYHPVTAIYRVRSGGGGGNQLSRHDKKSNDTKNNMCQVSTMLSKEDDVNIARFHPDSGHGFVYGTKQGRVRVVSTRPWMFYHVPETATTTQGGANGSPDSDSGRTTRN